MGLGDLLSGGLKTAKTLAIGGAEAAPLSALLGTGLVLGAGKPILDSIVKDPLGDEIKDSTQLAIHQLLERKKAERINRLVAINTARLAALDPHTFNEVLAGRSLPPGTAVFGGQPRVDLMQQLAKNMADGKYGFPDVPDNQFPGFT